MKKKTLISVICLLILSSAFTQNLKPKKDKETKKYGFVNPADEWVVKPIYDDADKFKEGFAKIYLNKKEGLIGETGIVLVEPQFDDIEKFKDDLAIVKLNKKYGFINKSGKTLCEPKYDYIDKFLPDGIAIIQKGLLFGLIKNDGIVLIEPRFNTIEKFIGNYSNVAIDKYTNQKRWGIIDRSGKVIFEPIYAFPLKFNVQNLSIANNVDDEVGIYLIVKNDGTILLDNLLYAYMDNQNCYIKNKSNKWSICDFNGKPVSKEFDEFAFSGKGGYNDKGYIAAKEGTKWGFIDATGKTIIPFKFDKISSMSFNQDYCAVMIGDKWGYIDRKGEFLKEPSFQEAGEVLNLYGELLATVKKDGKEYSYNVKTGELKLMATPANNVASQSSTTGSSSNTQSNNTNTTTQTNSSTSTTTTVENNDWIIGTWKVIEEKIGGQVKIGNKTRFVSYSFNKGGGGNYIERYDVMANQTQTKNMNWTLNGTSLKISSSNYTIIPSADKRSMTMNGPLGATWKLIKQ